MKDMLSDRFRSRRDVLLRQVLASCARRGETLRILDLGGRPQYWLRVGLPFLQEQRVHITISNLLETELAQRTGLPEGIFDFHVGNGCDLDFPDNAFDLCHSNSVIEHVGGWPEMQAFARETRRVAPAYYAQTPNYWFPVDPHFWRLPMIHWTPRPVRARLMRALPLASAGRAPDMPTAYSFVDGSRLLSASQMRTLFPDADLVPERLGALVKSYTAVRNPGAAQAKAAA